MLPPLYALLAPEGRCAGCFAASAADGINIVAVRKLVQTALLGSGYSRAYGTEKYGNAAGIAFRPGAYAFNKGGNIFLLCHFVCINWFNHWLHTFGQPLLDDNLSAAVYVNARGCRLCR